MTYQSDGQPTYQEMLEANRQLQERIATLEREIDEARVISAELVKTLAEACDSLYGSRWLVIAWAAFGFVCLGVAFWARYG